MIPEQLLLRALLVAIERLPDHRIEVDEAGLEHLLRKMPPGGGLVIEKSDRSLVIRRADHEDRAVMADRVRAAGGLLVEAPDMLFGILPDDR